MRNISERTSREVVKGAVGRMAMLPKWSRRLGYYGLALLLVAGAAVLRWALPDVLGPTPFLAFYLAWVGAAAFGGLGPGLLAVAASWLCIDLLFDPANNLIRLGEPATMGRLVILLAGGLAVSLVAERMRRGRIHERKQSREIAQAKQEWERTFDAVPDLIAVVDARYRILRANRAMAERLGKTPEECIGLTCHHCVHDRDTPPDFCAHAQSLADGREHTAEFYEERLGGHFLITCSPLFDQDGHMIGSVHIARDITERKRAEQVLRDSEERFRAAYEQAAVGIEMLDLEGRLLRGNGWLSQILGYNEDELRQRTLADITHPDDLREELPLLDELLAGKIPNYSIEKRYLHKEGRPVWVRVTSSLVRTSSPYRISIIEDITERKRARQAMQDANERLQEQAEELQAQAEELQAQAEELTTANEELRESEEQLRQRVEEVETLMEVAPVAIWVSHDPQCNHIVGNRTANNFFEIYERENVSANTSPMRRFFRNGQELKPEELPMQEAAAKNIDIPSTELDVLLPSGRWLNMLGSASPLLDAEGRVRGCVGAFVDITDRKQAEAERHWLAQQRQLALDAARMGWWHYDPATKVATWDDRYKEIFGVSGYQRLNEEILARLHPDDLPRVWAAVEAALDPADPKPYEIEYRVNQSDGSVRWVEAHGVAVFDGEGDARRATSFVGTVADITERKQAEEALRELTATLESKVIQRTAELEHRARQLQKLTLELSQAEDRERKRLAEILHDDLQQVLAAAKFHLGLMKNRTKHDPSLQAAAVQIDHMLKDAIDKSRSLSHELSPAVLHHGDLTEIFGWLASQVQAKHGLLVHVQVYGQVGSESDALKTFLYKAAQELLFNVVKHARVNEAGIRVRRLGRWICLSVSDHGRGFDPQQLGEAVGFGLLSIRERVELLGGRMKIRSSKDRGSTFFIVVPDGELVTALPSPGSTIRQPDFGPPRASKANDEPSRAEAAGLQTKRRLRVLLADDHEIVREGLISLLGEEGTIEVVGEAANGREAINLAGELRPDVVIMDVSMPLIDGDEATRQIKMLLPNARVVALSMFEDAETAERMHAAGAEAYILKTAPTEDLLAAIRGQASDA